MKSWVSLDFGAIAVALFFLVPGIALLFCPGRFLLFSNKVSMRLGRHRVWNASPRRFWSYRVAGAAFVATAAFVILTRGWTDGHTHVRSAPVDSRVPIVSKVGVLLLLGALLLCAVAPRSAFRLFMWDRYLDEELLAAPSFSFTVRLVGVVGSLALTYTLLRAFG